MGKGFKHGGGGGSPLNLHVVGGASQPLSPKENTIWVNTGTAITGWVISPVQPAGTNGMVWIQTGESSNAAFNALKKNFPSLTAGLVAGVKYAGGGGGGVLSPNGFATGLDYVPYDNFVARLHEGEMVLTKSQASAYRGDAASGGSVIVNQYIYSQAQTAADLMREARYEAEKAVLLDV